MTNAILRGTPDAGNPRVRFDEGEVASAKPRRGSRLHKLNLKCFVLVGACALASLLCAADRTQIYHIMVPKSLDAAEKLMSEGFAEGGDGVCLDLRGLKADVRTEACCRRLVKHAAGHPIYFCLYKGDPILKGDDAARMEVLKAAARAGAAIIDMPADLYNASPRELTRDPAAIERQRKMAEELRRLGAKVIVSSHMNENLKVPEILEHFQRQAERGADIVKIVHTVDTEAELAETVQAMRELQKSFSKPWLLLANGKKGREVRLLGCDYGCAIQFAVTDNDPRDIFKAQPTIRELRKRLQDNGVASGAGVHRLKRLGDVKMQAPAVRVFRANGQVKRFTATVGFDPAIYSLKRSYGPAHRDATLMGFRVFADGKLVADTGTMRPPDGTKTIAADLTGAKTIVLEGVDGGYWLGTPQLKALWKDATFDCGTAGTVEEDASGCETPQFGILTPPEGPEPRINGASEYGVRPGRPILYRVPVTGQAPLSVEVKGLPEGLVFNPQTRLLTGTIAARGDYRLVFSARNAVGRAEKTFTIRVGDRICLSPPMGWSAWNAWRARMTDEIIRETGRVFVEKGLADHGWCYVNLDDGWQRAAKPNAEWSIGKPGRQGAVRLPNGRIVPNSDFPNMKALADYLHSFGLKFGIYSSPGPSTCARYEGSYGHEAIDAATWAEWGVDYVKYDWCNYQEVFLRETAGRKPVEADYIKPFRVLYDELLKQPRDFVYSYSGGHGAAQWGEANGSNIWRTWGDLKDSWGAVLNAADSAVKQVSRSHPGFWADPDMLVVGRLDTGVLGEHDSYLTPNEQYTHLTVWALLNAPLLIGCQMDKLDDFTLGLLRNPEVIDVDQDIVHPPARQTRRTDADWVLVKNLADGAFAVGVVNLHPFKRRITLDFAANGLPSRAKLRDLWRRADLGTFEGSYTVELPPHAPLFLKVTQTDKFPVERRVAGPE